MFNQDVHEHENRVRSFSQPPQCDVKPPKPTCLGLKLIVNVSLKTPTQFVLFAALIFPSSDELSIFTFPGDFLKSVQTQQSDWKIKRSFAQVRMFMSRDKIFNYFASFQHISKTGWIQHISSARWVGFS